MAVSPVVRYNCAVSSNPEPGVDTVVVGAGVIGAAATLALARAGHSVRVVDAGRAVAHGSTSASAGIVRVHATDPQSCLMADESIQIWNMWAEFLEAPPEEQLASFTECGSVILDNEDGYVPAASAALRAAGIQHDYWHTPELSERLPYLDVRRFGPVRPVDDPGFWEEPTGELAGALYTRHSGYVSDPTLAAVNLMNAATRRGARLQLAATVVGLLRRGDTVTGVELGDGTTIHADSVLIAAGPHTHALLHRLGATEDFRIKTRRLREELHHVPAPAGLDVAHAVHLVDGDLGINFRPEVGNAFLVGGNGAAVDGETRIEDPDKFDQAVSRTAWERNTLRIARRIPGLGVPTRRAGVVGLYDVTEDWLPIYDRTIYDGLFVAMGTSGNQFKNAPLVGDLLRQIIECEREGVDHRTRAMKSLVSGAEYRSEQFSRLREPQSGGSRG